MSNARMGVAIAAVLVAAVIGVAHLVVRIRQ